MNNKLTLILVGIALLSAETAMAGSPFGRLRNHGGNGYFGGISQRMANSQPWHGQHYYLQSGQPTALVVPPNAMMQQNYSWGVSQNTMTPIYHQYGSSAMPSAGGAFYATPPWPSNTRQFGVYPVRAPW